MIEEHIFGLLRLNEESFAKLVRDEGKGGPTEPLLRSPVKLETTSGGGGNGLSQFNPYGSNSAYAASGSSSSSSSSSNAVRNRFEPIPLQLPSRVTVDRQFAGAHPSKIVSPIESQDTSSQWNTQNYAPTNAVPNSTSSSSSSATFVVPMMKDGIASRNDFASTGQKRKVDDISADLPTSMDPSFLLEKVSMPLAKVPALRPPVKPPATPIVMALTQPLQVSQSVSALLQDEEW